MVRPSYQIAMKRTKRGQATQSALWGDRGGRQGDGDDVSFNKSDIIPVPLSPLNVGFAFAT